MRCCAATRPVTKPGVPQHLQVLGHRGLRDGQCVDEGADAVLGGPQPVEDAATGRVGEDGERLHGAEHASERICVSRHGDGRRPTARRYPRTSERWQSGRLHPP